jgi:hypothetical protein
MTLSEVKDILVTRIGWRDDKTLGGLVSLSADNLLSDSGRNFQSEHPAVTLENIYHCQPVEKIDNAGFQEYLENLREQCVLQVLSDTFEKDYVNDSLLNLYPTAFDNAISLRMVIIVGELIMTSTRSNAIERLNKEFVGKLNYDLYREAPNKFAIRGANYQYTLGIATRYGFEISSVQRRFGQQRNMIQTITKGAVSNPNFPLDSDIDLNLT